MPKTTVYRIIGDQKIKMAVMVKNENDDVVKEDHFKEEELYKSIETEYDNQGNATKITENEDGFETVSIYEFDEEGELLSSVTTTGNDEIEKVSTQVNNGEKIQLFYRHGVYAEKIVENQTEDGEEILHYNADGELTKRIQEVAYKDQTHTSVFDETNVLQQLQIEFFDEADELIEKRVFDENKKLISLEKFVVENELILSHSIQRKIEGGLLELENKYTYDAQENETQHQISSPEGKLIAVEEKKYDAQNRLIEKRFENLSGNPSFGLSILMVYEFDEI